MFVKSLSLAALVAPALANVFLRAQGKAPAHTLSSDVVREVLSEELAAVATEKSKKFEDELRPLFAAMPKNDFGNLEAATVRYVLHRYFVHKHGWHVKGLDAAGSSWNESSPLDITKEQAPALIQGVFEKRVHGHGLNLQELAVFAATLSDLIQQEAVIDLEAIFTEEGRDHQGKHTAQEVEDVLGTFLATYITGNHEDDYGELKGNLSEDYVSWEKKLEWTRDLRRTVDVLRRDVRNPFVGEEYTFDDTIAIAEHFVDRFGSQQNLDCHVLKEKLIEVEDEGTGRVPLNRFYGDGIDEEWPFYEGIDYLRSVGALDETDPQQKSVLIANYMFGKANCWDTSEFYSVCCRDECEDLMSHVEVGVGSGIGTPGRIAEIVSSLESDTVAAPRNLSTALVSRLENIAAHHAGRVPLHGRLFTQWMHHAFPRECQFPHLAGTSAHHTPDAWKEAGYAHEASDEEMSQYMSEHNDATHRAINPSALPWTQEEELVAWHRHEGFAVPAQAKESRTSPLRVILVLSAMASALVPLLRGQKAHIEKGLLPKYTV